MKIAFDFDGVLADTSILKHRWFYDTVNLLNENKRIMKMYKKLSSIIFTRENLLKTKMIDENIPFYLHELCNENELIIITNRPSYMLEWIKEWLKINGILDCFSNIFSSSDDTKGTIAIENDIDILIDDDIKHLTNNGVEYNILFNGDNTKNWNHLYKHINTISQKVWNKHVLIKK